MFVVRQNALGSSNKKHIVLLQRIVEITMVGLLDLYCNKYFQMKNNII